MKLSTTTDFTKFPRAGSIVRRDAGHDSEPFDVAVLAHDERHLRRRALTLGGGEKILVDLPEPLSLETGDRLLLDDGRTVGIVAADEELFAIRPRDAVHLAELAWHIGNRHLAAAIAPDRILILRDHVIKAMLEGLGAEVSDLAAPFEPVRGAYSGQTHSHGHVDESHHAHDHEGHGQRDGHGRGPGDPHYGHSHA